MKVASVGGLAVVTGAAGGLGSSFANKLAKRGYRLLLIDRRQQSLDELCESLAARHGASVEALAADLCQREEVEKLARRLEQRADVELLVNNAGFGSVEYFVDAEAGSLMDMVDVHVAAPVRLTRAVLPGMIAGRRGAIINMSSVGGFLQCKGNVGYGSTKSFLAFFSMTLAQELKGTNVRVQALCPGFVRTPFHEATGMKGFTTQRISAGMWMSADEVVECSLRNLNGKQVIVIPGLGYSVFTRLAQMPLLQPLMRWLTHVPRLPMAPAPAITAAAFPVEAITVPAVEACAVVSLMPDTSTAVEVCPEPRFAVAELSESMTAS